jgi:arylsulfatase A
MPHVPLFASPDFKRKSEGGLYGDVIEEMDCNVGRVLDHLKALKIEENTLVVLTSDNGFGLIIKENGGSSVPLSESRHVRRHVRQRVPGLAFADAPMPPPHLYGAF